ncbi:hypothetical protein ACFU7Y_26820 [Kitasatospora sp. NPDC057542]|uniref:hypothetical protein n=1 Tax=Streptomycetaceae TaxID=2062 RepID=UPI001CCE2817|nr:hypothetical protein [Streptomyces sp. LS1784]
MPNGWTETFDADLITPTNLATIVEARAALLADTVQPASGQRILCPQRWKALPAPPPTDARRKRPQRRAKVLQLPVRAADNGLGPLLLDLWDTDIAPALTSLHKRHGQDTPVLPPVLTPAPVPWFYL